MSLSDVIRLAGHGVPGLDAVVQTVGVIYNSALEVKVYREQCEHLASRCITLLLAVHESSADMVGTRAMLYADEIEGTIAPIRRKVEEWASYTLVKSFWSIVTIKEGIAHFYRDLDACFAKYNVQMSMELNRNQREQLQLQERDREEMRRLLQIVASSVDELKAVRQMPSPAALEMMQSIEEELDDPRLETSQANSLQNNLAVIRERAIKLPPMADLSGDVERIGEYPKTIGTYNDIYIGMWAGQTKVALRLPRALPDDERSQSKFEKEVDIWRRLSHPNVVRLYGVAYFGTRAYMVSHWMDHGNAISYVKTHPDADRLRILSEVAAGLEYLQLSKIVHGDLRGANVLITARHKACLSDFGFSKILEEFSQGNSSGAANSRWTAAEILNPTLVSQSTAAVSASMRTDIWSFGMLSLELLTSLPPFSEFPNDMTVAINVAHGQLPRRPSTCAAITDDVWALMVKCWNRQPSLRPSVTVLKDEIKQLRGGMAVSPMSVKFPLSSSPLSIPLELPPDPPRKPSVRIKTSRSSMSSTGSKPVKTERRPSSSSSLLGRLNPFGHPRSPSVMSPSSSSSRMSPVFGGGAPEISISLPNDYGLRFSTSSSSRTCTSDTALLTERYNDPNMSRSADGTIEAGTLDALLGHLVAPHSDVHRSVEYREYRDVFFSTYVAFTSADEVLSLLLSRFHDADASPGQQRTLLRIYIITVMRYWLTCEHTRIDSAIKDKILAFAMSVVSHPNTSTRMRELAKELMMESGAPISPTASIPSVFSQAVLASPPANGKEIAFGLMLLEGDNFSRIFASDCIYDLRGQAQELIRAASDLNNRVVYWVKKAILRNNDLRVRSELVESMITAAEVSYQYRNFASLWAIVTALSSITLTRMTLTFERLDVKARRSLERLGGYLDPTHNFSAYRAALNSSEKPCIPILAVHMHDLHATVTRSPDEVDINGTTMVNFAKWRRFHTTAREFLHHKPPDMSKYRNSEFFVYLQEQLGRVTVGAETDQGFERQSKRHAHAEEKMREQRLPELYMLGID